MRKVVVQFFRKPSKTIEINENQILSPCDGKVVVMEEVLEDEVSNFVEPDSSYSVLELFAGAGGLAVGMEKAGLNCVALNEIDKWACQTLRKNRPNWDVLEGDIKDFNFVLIGHSHYSFAIRNENSILINPGSVGQSRQNGGKASWCILNTDNSCFQFLSTDYSTKNLLEEVSKKDPDVKYLGDILVRQ